MQNPEIDIFTVPGQEWREMLATASVLDLVHGGYYRARRDAVLFFCGPENAPASWQHGFPEGSPETPRAAVGSAEVVHYEEENDQFTLRLTVSNWGAAREVSHAWERGEYRDRYQEFVLDQEAALRGGDAERAWLREQFARLRRHAGGDLIRDG